MATKNWLLLLSGPVLFFLLIVVVSAYFSIQGVAEAAIPEKVTQFAPHILLLTLSGLTLSLYLFFHQELIRLYAQASKPGRLYQLGVGMVLGTALALLYLFYLSPLLGQLQQHYGDYVPAGSILPTISQHLAIFFIANVILAPLVEEIIYRGIAIPVLSARFGKYLAVVISCCFFGLLHWTGGVWYMLLTGLVAGGLFAALYCWKNSIVAPFFAHFSLNLVEFIYVWKMQIAVQ